MDMKLMNLILASGSPRRKELLTLLGVPFRVIKSDAPEIITQQEPGRIVEELSWQKARAVADTIDDGIILGADTIVWQDGQVLGKPEDRQDAYRMLDALQGASHSVFTGVTLLIRKNGQDAGERQFFEETIVHVHEMSAKEIEAYLDTGEAFDKAGSYGIQGPFAAYVDRIEGDYQNVVGLPVAALYQALKCLAETGCC